MTALEREIKERGWYGVLEELSGVAARARNENLARGGAREFAEHDALLGTLINAARAGRAVDATGDGGRG